MKPSKIFVSSRRQSVGRFTFVLASCVAAGAVALAAPQKGGPSLRLSDKLAKLPQKISARTNHNSLVAKTGPVHVMVELDAPAASVMYGEALKAAHAAASNTADPTRVPMAGAENDSVARVEIDSAAAARVADHVSSLDGAQKALLPSIANVGGKVIFRTQRAFNGVAVRIAPEKIADLAKLPGVKSVRPMAKKYPTAFSDVEFLGAPSFWAKTAPKTGKNVRGNGIKIAVIDSGLDYTHSNFGGPGTPNYAGITDTTPVPNAFFPTPKIPFGHDFAGDNYNADGSPDQQEPHPDDNPLDSGGHGTACASLAAGFGVNAGGTTFTGPYDGSVPYSALKISPGMAPLAKLIPLRVFGSAGSTFLTTEAIEYAMDPNRDGNLNDHVDIISMSLGSDWGTVDDDSAIASANAVQAGVIVTAASGNAGDSYYITSSPASAPGVISVAASFNDREGYIADASVVVKSPPEIKGNKSYGIATTNSSNGTVTANVVKLVPNSTGDASTPENAAQLKGKIAYADRVPGQGANTATRAKKAGAVGIIFGADDTGAGGNPFRLTTTSAGDQIPELVISKDDGTFIKQFCQFDPNTGKAQNPINATIKPDHKVFNNEGEAADTMPTYSSRGPLLGSTTLKPDITAPAEFTGVALTGTGTGEELFNGTSSATPHVAGGLALMKQLHPNWTVEEIMALAMNTATHDLFEESGQAGYSAPTETRRGVSRVGAGRLDLTKASQSNVVVFNATDANRVSVSFGNVEVPSFGSVSLSKQVTIRNKGNEDMEYDLTYDSREEVGDATFESVSHVSVPAHSEKTITVTFSATGETLQHTKDASVADTQAFPRQYLSEAAGYGVLTPSVSWMTGKAAPQVAEQWPTIRIPLYAAPKPVGLMRTAQEALTPPANNTGTFNLTLTGDFVFSGGNTPVDILGLVKPFECQYASSHAASSNFSSNPNIIRYVGVSSDYAVQENKKKTAVTFAIEGFGDASVPSYFSADKEVYIDVNFDNKDDFVIYADQLPDTNVYLSHLADANTFASVAGGYQYFTNIFPGNALDTNAFNNSIIMLTVDAEALGYTGAGQSAFQYHVATFDASGLIDLTPYLRFDIAKPGLDGTGPTGDPEGNGGGYYLDVPTQLTNDKVKVAFNGANFQANKSKGVLMAHMHNERGHRGELVEIRTPKITSFSPTEGPVGTTVTITGEGFTNATKVKFSPNKPANQVNVVGSNTISCKVPAGTVTGPITVSNSAGGDESSQNFKVTGPQPSPSPTPSPTASPTN